MSVNKLRAEKLLIFGGSGMLGSRIVDILSKDFLIDSPTHEELDLHSVKSLKQIILGGEYSAIIYAAGLTNQEVCEKEKADAKFLNSKVAGLIAKEAKKSNSKLVYFSTDAVFSGKEKVSYKEEDKRNPVNYYGYTKALGEDLVLGENSNNLVIRVASLYTHNFLKKTDFARKSLEFLMTGKECVGIEDQFFNPTYTELAANVLKKSFDKNVKGIVHVGTKDVISNLNFIKLLAEKFNFSKSLVKSVKFNDFFKNATFPRGQHQILSTDKANQLFGNIITTNDKNISEFKKNYYG